MDIHEQMMADAEVTTQLGKDELAHFGVLGMKWGKRKAKPPTVTKGKSTKSSADRPKTKKPRLTSDDIHQARIRQDIRKAKIVAADSDYRLATTAAGKKRALATVTKYAKQGFDSGDAEIAKTATVGEKVAAVSLGIIGGVIVGQALRR